MKGGEGGSGIVEVQAGRDEGGVGGEWARCGGGRAGCSGGGLVLEGAGGDRLLAQREARRGGVAGAGGVCGGSG